MNPVARSLLKELAVIGARLEPAGEELRLRAGTTAVPGTLVRRVREAKRDLLAILTSPDDRVRSRPGANLDQHQRASAVLEARIVKWLNDHPAPSTAGRCAWCGKAESPGGVVLPFGTEPGTHAWLHPDCWPAWHEKRRSDAILALQSSGNFPEND